MTKEFRIAIFRARLAFARANVHVARARRLLVAR